MQEAKPTCSECTHAAHTTGICTYPIGYGEICECDNYDKSRATADPAAAPPQQIQYPITVTAGQKGVDMRCANCNASSRGMDGYIFACGDFYCWHCEDNRGRHDGCEKCAALIQKGFEATRAPAPDTADGLLRELVEAEDAIRSALHSNDEKLWKRYYAALTRARAYIDGQREQKPSEEKLTVSGARAGETCKAESDQA